MGAAYRRRAAEHDPAQPHLAVFRGVGAAPILASKSATFAKVLMTPRTGRQDHAGDEGAGRPS